ncbi:MAG TPA: choice-of-anchor P family protein [Nocardioides sp.]|uniref:choice-of-anchor P family protein n=1 Tax=Nocardioides sp. TaxID=35761 RepID=UPI002F4074AD
MKHRTALAVAIVPLSIGLALTAGPTYAGTATKITTFAFKATGFGTRVIGGQVPAGSGTTAYQGISCTNKAGKWRTNNIDEATLPGVGQATGVKTQVWTTSRNGVVASHSSHSIAKLVLAQSQLGSLEVSTINSRAKAYHNGSGFHAVTTTQIGALTFTPPVGPAQTFPAPTPDQPLTIPGLATVYAGQHATHHWGNGAIATAYALRVDVLATGTSVRLARSHAALNSGLTGGLFSGRSAATHVVTAGNSTLKSGSNPLTPMPCQGTYGKTIEKSLASLDLGGQIVVKGASSSERGVQGDHRAHGVSRAEVNQIRLGGQVEIDGIVGRVTVDRTPSGVTKTIKGTRLGSVTVSGQAQTFPKTGVLEIPGVAKLERAVVTRTHSGISVIGLRITLLDGSGAVINLAEARLKIHSLTH